LCFIAWYIVVQSNSKLYQHTVWKSLMLLADSLPRGSPFAQKVLLATLLSGGRCPYSAPPSMPDSSVAIIFSPSILLNPSTRIITPLGTLTAPQPKSYLRRFNCGLSGLALMVEQIRVGFYQCTEKACAAARTSRVAHSLQAGACHYTSERGNQSTDRSYNDDAVAAEHI
jgi:hypothetical protein